ncbi:hypothetical protein BJV82DRAFT_23940 [Fennellomyces sp. T-0311]|nr:hypothetical protein BJV82DRAFT_23940 [Fennellomyces sp. T-0311]
MKLCLFILTEMLSASGQCEAREKPFFLMTKEIRIPSPKKFSQKTEEMGAFLKGSWTLTKLLMKSIEALKVIKQSHQESERKVRRCHQLLSLETLVTPSVQKWAKRSTRA